MLLFLLGLALSIPQSFAAPHPATSSSFVVGSNSGRYFSEHGFKVSIGESDWRLTKPPQKFKNIEAIYLGPVRADENQRASMTIRRDRLEKKTSLEYYIRKWSKDYHRFGFDVLASQKVKVGKNIGFMLDLTHSETAHQLRQLVFIKNKNAVIFTCRDHQSFFRESLKECNRIIRTFTWTL